MNTSLNSLPEILTFDSGAEVTTESWESRRTEMQKILAENEYGNTPSAATATGRLIDSENNAYAGKVVQSAVEVSFDTPGGIFSFPMKVFVPKKVQNPQCLLHIAFSPATPDKYYPVEEICDRGFATAMFCYTDITSDDEDFTNGLAGKLFPSGRSADDSGKIGIWAYAASRAMDCLMEFVGIDHARITVIGHSRLGKTALWAAARDSRFFSAVSNNSGCSGAALSRGKSGETVELINDRFPFWFCSKYSEFSGRESSMPFDQHFLLACIAPRKLMVFSAAEDSWADPKKEWQAFIAAQEAFELTGGEITYHVRPGTHFLSREDWNRAMDILS